MQKWQEKGQRCTKIPIFIDFLPVQPDVPHSLYSINFIFMPPDRMIRAYCLSVQAITKMSNITEMCNIRAIRVIFLEIILLKAVI